MAYFQRRLWFWGDFCLVLGLIGGVVLTAGLPDGRLEMAMVAFVQFIFFGLGFFMLFVFLKIRQQHIKDVWIPTQVARVLWIVGAFIALLIVFSSFPP